MKMKPASLLLMVPLLLALGGCFHASVTIVTSSIIETDPDTTIIPETNGRVFIDQHCGKFRTVSAQPLKDSWGVPTKRVIAEDGTETWHYRRGLRWAGLSVFLTVGIIPIPIPLVVPIGSREYEFVVSNNQIQQAHVLFSKYGPSTGFHVGLTFDESGRTLNSAWAGRHPFWGDDQFFGSELAGAYGCPAEKRRVRFDN